MYRYLLCPSVYTTITDLFSVVKHSTALVLMVSQSLIGFDATTVADLFAISRVVPLLLLIDFSLYGNIQIAFMSLTMLWYILRELGARTIALHPPPKLIKLIRS